MVLWVVLSETYPENTFVRPATHSLNIRRFAPTNVGDHAKSSPDCFEDVFPRPLSFHPQLRCAD